MSMGDFFTHMEKSDTSNKPTLESSFFSIEQRPKHPFRPQVPCFRSKSPSNPTDQTLFLASDKEEGNIINPSAVNSAKGVDLFDRSESSSQQRLPPPTTNMPTPKQNELLPVSAFSDEVQSLASTSSRPVSSSARPTSSLLMEREASRRSAPPKRPLEALSSLPTKQQWSEKEEIIRRLTERLNETKRLHREKMELCATARAELVKEAASVLMEDNTILRCELREICSQATAVLQEAERCLQ